MAKNNKIGLTMVIKCMRNKRIKTIEILSQSDIKSILDNDDLSSYMMNFKKNNRISSDSEVTFITHIMAFFKPLNFQKIGGSIVRINGSHGDYVVEFELQRKVYNPKTKRTWSLDLVIKLNNREDNEPLVEVCLEYDGDNEHITSYGIIDDKERDLEVLKQTGIQTLRIDPSIFQTTEQRKDVYKAVKSLFKRFIKLRHKGGSVKDVMELVTVGEESSKESTKASPKYQECPLCEGVQILGSQSCPVCLGNGTVLYNAFSERDIEVFDSFDCPDCSKRSLKKCYKCRGKGLLTREEAIKIRREELKD